MDIERKESDMNGGKGIKIEYKVMRKEKNMEKVKKYEGKKEVKEMIIGSEKKGIKELL